MAWMAVLLSTGVAARLTEPYLYKIVVDTLANGLVAGSFVAPQVRMLVLIVIIWFVLAVIVNATSAQASYLVWRIGNRSAQEVNMTGYRRLLQLDYAKHMAEHSSRRISMIWLARKSG